ncbi:MAG: hypothetical protein H0V46_07435, partial [Sphingomonas sp.]|nr:hypothetical protein [Sphingomonas sp.]
MIQSNISTSPQASGGWFFNHLPEILWHRRLYVGATAVIVFIASVIAAFSLPTLYKSTASMLVQSQDLPSELVDAPATGMIGQRIARIRERVLSRGDLIALIEQNDLYPEERQSKPLSTVVEKMREATAVSALENDIGTGGEQAGNTIAIQVSFEYPEPVKAQAVLQSYV